MAKNERTNAAASAVSQAQSTSGEPEQREQTPEQAVKSAGSTAEVTGSATDIQFFDGTVAKIDADGNEVMSDHLAPGETLRRATDAGTRYTAGRHTDRAQVGRAEEDEQIRADKREKRAAAAEAKADESK